MFQRSNNILESIYRWTCWCCIKIKVIYIPGINASFTVNTSPLHPALNETHTLLWPLCNTTSMVDWQPAKSSSALIHFKSQFWSVKIRISIIRHFKQKSKNDPKLQYVPTGKLGVLIQNSFIWKSSFLITINPSPDWIATTSRFWGLSPLSSHRFQTLHPLQAELASKVASPLAIEADNQPKFRIPYWTFSYSPSCQRRCL